MTVNSISKEDLDLISQRAESNLKESVLPFWTRNTWDQEYGGFLTRLDRKGELVEEREKHLMMQVRMIASLSAAHQFGFTTQGYLDLADKAFEWLVEKHWDKDEGGFFFTLSRDGESIDKRKNTDAHGYALTGVSQFYMTSGNKEVLAWAKRIFDVVVEKAKDREYGYFEEFDGAQKPMLNDEQMDLGGRTDIKTIDMHTNVLEGFYYLFRASGDTKHRQALKDVLKLIAEKGIHPKHGGTITAFDYDWNPVPDTADNLTTSYGLNLELAWLMMAAVDLLKIERVMYQPKILGLIDHALAYGFDEDRGGIAAYGPVAGKAAESDLPKRCLLRAWWEQVEALNAFSGAYEWTRNEKYLRAFVNIFEWCWAHQIDHEFGDWFQDIDPESLKPVTTDKGCEFKTAFHVTRAMIKVIEFVNRMGRQT